MDLMRSEKMTFVQLIIPVESAHRAISYLGELGLLQFRDVTFYSDPTCLIQTLSFLWRDLFFVFVFGFEENFWIYIFESEVLFKLVVEVFAFAGGRYCYFQLNG